MLRLLRFSKSLVLAGLLCGKDRDEASAMDGDEASAMDGDEASAMDGDYMGGRGTFDPSRNPNAYPMTDQTRFPSGVAVRVNGAHAGRYELADDPANHRGIFSCHSPLQDRQLREAGSYGQPLRVPIPAESLATAARTGTIGVRLEVDAALPGGLAIYGARFGRYPIDPTLVFL